MPLGHRIFFGLSAVVILLFRPERAMDKGGAHVHGHTRKGLLHPGWANITGWAPSGMDFIIPFIGTKSWGVVDNCASRSSPCRRQKLITQRINVICLKVETRGSRLPPFPTFPGPRGI